MKIDITNGYVEMRDSLSRKAQRDYRKVLFDGVTVGSSDFNKSKKDSLKINLVRQDEAQDVLILAMIQNAVINEKKVEVNQAFIDEMDNDDFDKLAKHCDEVFLKKNEEKKS